MSQSVYNSDFRDPKKVKQMMKEKEEREEREEKENSGKNWGNENVSANVKKHEKKSSNNFATGFARKPRKYEVLDIKKCSCSCTNIKSRSHNNNHETAFKFKPATSGHVDKNPGEMTKSTQVWQCVIRSEFIVEII